MKIRFLIYFFLLLSSAAAVRASGFGISPSSMGFSLLEGSESSRQLILYNTGGSAGFSVTSSSQDIVVTPSNGVLPGNGKAIVTVTAKGRKAGLYREDITVRFFEPGSENKVSLGLGLSVAVKIAVSKASAVQANAFVGSLISLGIVISGISSYIGIKKLSKTQHL